jgi:hypothetical protein
MSIVSTDLLPKCCANPNLESDVTGPGGGAVALEAEFVIADPAGFATTVEVVSDASTDLTAQVQMRAVKASNGVIQYSNVVTLNGLTPVSVTFPSGDNTILRVVSFFTGFLTDGWVTLRISGGGAMLALLKSNDTIPENNSLSFRPFAASFSTVAGITRYDKMFWYNNHASLTAQTPTYRLIADPKARIRQGIHASKNDSATIVNRVTAPGGVTFVDDNVDQVGSDLLPAENQGVWIEFASTPSDPSAPFQDTFTTQITVSSA